VAAGYGLNAYAVSAAWPAVAGATDGPDSRPAGAALSFAIATTFAPLAFRCPMLPEANAGARDPASAGATYEAIAPGSLHWLPVASVPPSVPPEHTWAWSGAARNTTAANDNVRMIFMHASRDIGD